VLAWQSFWEMRKPFPPRVNFLFIIIGGLGRNDAFQPQMAADGRR
jgi:hypothetical protein